MSSGGSLTARGVVRELLWAEGNLSGDVVLLPSPIPLQLVRVFQKHPRFEHGRLKDSSAAIHQERNVKGDV
jgi:hypothetical protein